MIKLEFFRLLPENSIGEEADVDCRYTPYRVFVMETRLYPMIYDMFPDVVINPKSVYDPKKKRMDVYLSIRNSKTDEEINLSHEQKEKIQKELDKINSQNIDYALINLKELYRSIGKRYSFSWFKSVIEFTGLNEEYNPFIKDEGIYLTFDPDSEYNKYYYETCKFLKDRIEEFYSKGIIVLPKNAKQLVEKWGLIAIDEENKLYQPSWVDRRFANDQVSFLLEKVSDVASGASTIKLLLPDNLVKRHGIIKALQEIGKPCILEGSYLKVQVENINDAQKVATYVDNAKLLNGRVVVLGTSRLSEIYLFFDYAEKYKKGDCVSYSVSSNETPYVFSCLLKEDDYMSGDILKERFRNYALERLIEVSKISKLKNKSPHEIIEEEYAAAS